MIYSIAFDASHLRRTYRVPRSGLKSRFPDHIAGATSQGFCESDDHFHRDIVLPAFDKADIVAVAVDSFGKRFLRISFGFPPCAQGVAKIQAAEILGQGNDKPAKVKGKPKKAAVAGKAKGKTAQPKRKKIAISKPKAKKAGRNAKKA